MRIIKTEKEVAKLLEQQASSAAKGQLGDVGKGFLTDIFNMHELYFDNVTTPEAVAVYATNKILALNNLAKTVVGSNIAGLLDLKAYFKLNACTAEEFRWLSYAFEPFTASTQLKSTLTSTQIIAGCKRVVDTLYNALVAHKVDLKTFIQVDDVLVNNWGVPNPLAFDNPFYSRWAMLNSVTKANNIATGITRYFKGKAGSKNIFVPLHGTIDLNINLPASYLVARSADQLATYLAQFCADQSIYWDDTLTTTYEREEILKTRLGKALEKAGCFVSTAKTQAAILSQKATKKATNTNTNGPVIKYKQLTNLSSKVPNLVGTAGTKTYLQTNYVYCVEAMKLGKNTPRVFITPISNTGVPYSSSKASSINIGSGNGYSDCVLWFKDINEAVAVTDAVNSLNSDHKTALSTKPYGAFHVAKTKPDPNGYYPVTIEIPETLLPTGQKQSSQKMTAYIKASKLNEQIEDPSDEKQEPKQENSKVDEAKKTVRISLNSPEATQTTKISSLQKANKTNTAYNINDIEVYSAAFDKYRD